MYAGAAPGTHVRFLSDLFPDVKFVLIDPAPFSCKEVKGRIECIRDLMDDELARTFAGRKGERGRMFYVNGFMYIYLYGDLLLPV